MTVFFPLIALLALGSPTPSAAPLPEGCHSELAERAGLGAQSLNVAGHRCYEAGQMAEAAALFRAAVEADEEHALAHYNLACTLALLRRAGEVCPHQAYLSTVLHHLERSVALDEGRRARMREDDDLREARTTVRYHRLDGADLSTAEGLARALPHLRFFSPPRGVYGNLQEIRLQPGGRIEGQRLAFDDEGIPTGHEPMEGSWKLEGTTVILDIGEGPHRYTLREDGALVDEQTGQVAWRDLPEECSA